MAKIYETPEDVERERLTQKVQYKRESQSSWLNYGAVTTLMGLLALEVNKLSAKLPPQFKSKFWNSFDRGFNKVVGWGGLIVGAASIGISLLSGWAGKKARVDLKKIGPEQPMLLDKLGNPMPLGDLRNALAIEIDKRHASRLEKDRESAAISAATQVTIPPR